MVAAGACDAENAPPLVIEGSGGVEGFLFFDADLNGVFDPSSGDFGVEGVRVAVQNRGTTETFATATTGELGRFEIAGIPVGTHDLQIDTTSVPEGVSFCQNPVPVTVYIDEVQYRPVVGRGGCVVPIAEAEQEPLGSFVTVQGLVTSFPGQIDAAYTYVEDSSSGIRIFDGSLEGQGIEIGDQIELSGELAAFGGDLQLTGVTVNSITPDAATVTPMATTTAAIADVGPQPTDPLQGRLVRVENAELVGAFGSGGVNERNGFIDDGSGVVQIRLEDGVVSDASTINDLFTVGQCYDITGAVGSFSGTGQLFPRSLDDIEEVPCS